MPHALDNLDDLVAPQTAEEFARVKAKFPKPE
jgi:hypothetical protein